ncbi:PAS domain S-box protein [Falsirhodobacter sp. 1013]|uniref:sensor domain-containing protein n=1 Tax=Falsirhodobacter sp. 1013 TaxID=3417566 RepID=UPI003EC0EE21
MAPNGSGSHDKTVSIPEASPPSLSMEVLERLLNDVSQPLAAKDRAHRFLLVNSAMCALLKHSRDELLGRSIADFEPEDQALMSAADDEHVFATGRERVVDEVVTVDGSARLMRIHKRLLTRQGPEGDEPLLVVSALDVTESRQTERALRESEEHYRNSMELNPQIPWVADAQGNIIEFSERWCEITGMSREEARGEGWAKALHPEDVGTTSKVWSHCVATGAPFDHEYRVRIRDGSYRWFRARGQAQRDSLGRISRWYGTSEDIHSHKQDTLALLERERQLQTVFNQTSIGLLHQDRHNRVVMVNQRYLDILGRTQDELEGILPIRFVHPRDIERQTAQLQEHEQTGEPLQLETRYVRTDGSIIWCNINMSYVRNEAGDITGTVTVAEDITRHTLAEERARKANDLLQDVIDSADDLIFVKDVNGRYRAANKKFGGAAVLGKTDYDLSSAHIADKYVRDDQEVLATGQTLSIEEYVTEKGTRRYYHTVKVPWRQDEAIIGVIGIARDITHRKDVEERLLWAAYHDELTGLANRRLFQEQIGKALEECAAAGCLVGLLAMDVDHFKQINDRFGHDVGDVCLKGFAERLRQVVGDRGQIARLGGDEFAVVLPDVRSERDISALAKAIVDRMYEPLFLHDDVLDCHTSIGGAITKPGLAVTPEELRKQADLALYASKAAGRGVFTMFRPSMQKDLQKLASALEAAEQAIAFDWIVPHYQPKVDLRSGKLIGFEALLRWNDPRKGLQSPETIAPAFDNTDLGIAIGERIQSCVFRHLRGWLDSGTEVGRIAVNASSSEFRRDDYAERVLAKLRVAGIPTHCLEIEVTEGVFLGDGSEFVKRALFTLSAAGVTVALDDFGTGYASLSHLKQFPVNVLKIDRSFIGGLERDASDAAVVKVLLGLGQNLGILVVAEGVETAGQAALLRQQGCTAAQGFYFGHPMAASDVCDFVSSWDGAKR